MPFALWAYWWLVQPVLIAKCLAVKFMTATMRHYSSYKLTIAVVNELEIYQWVDVNHCMIRDVILSTVMVGRWRRIKNNYWEEGKSRQVWDSCWTWTRMEPGKWIIWKASHSCSDAVCWISDLWTLCIDLCWPNRFLPEHSYLSRIIHSTMTKSVADL